MWVISRRRDWQAYDHRDQSLANGHSLDDGTRANNEGYNGVNIYGDEPTVNMYTSLQPTLMPQMIALSNQLGGALSPQQLYDAILPPKNMSDVTRTGYNEADLVDYTTKNMKLNAALHYRITGNLEAILQGSYGSGTTVYTGADRYSLKNFNMGQYKVELKSPDFYVRFYTTQERAGDSYAAGTLAIGINDTWKSNNQWFTEYFGTYALGAGKLFQDTFMASLQQGQAPAAALAAAQAAVQSQQPISSMPRGPMLRKDATCLARRNSTPQPTK